MNDDNGYERLKAIDALPQACDPEALIAGLRDGTIIAELRGIYAALPDNADVSGRALWELIKRLEQE